MDWQSRIDEVMDNFDFDRVHEVMTAIDWQWQDKGVPEKSELRATARKLMNDVIKMVGEGGEVEYLYGSGGFEATAYSTGYLNLRFVVADWDAPLMEG